MLTGSAKERNHIAALEAGADMLELGVPFSDPLADGPVIQRASERAVARGTRLTDVLGLAQQLRAARPSASAEKLSSDEMRELEQLIAKVRRQKKPKG